MDYRGTVKILNYDPDCENGYGKIAAIKILRQVFGLGLKDAKDFIDDLPGVLEHENAPQAVVDLQAAGIEAELVQFTSIDGLMRELVKNLVDHGQYLQARKVLDVFI